MGRETITTKSPIYIRARRSLDDPWAELIIPDIAVLFGIGIETAKKWALTGRMGAHRDRGPFSPWKFNVNDVRKELGLEPL